mmetsp:Transcript_44107/g.118601  ORF Transcript_44107/g.118601 Transcript_44107/m.118601 type:complete len:249 (+) Transcript_44107:198-944(+)
MLLQLSDDQSGPRAQRAGTAQRGVGGHRWHRRRSLGAAVRAAGAGYRAAPPRRRAASKAGARLREIALHGSQQRPLLSLRSPMCGVVCHAIGLAGNRPGGSCLQLGSRLFAVELLHLGCDSSLLEPRPARPLPGRRLRRRLRRLAGGATDSREGRSQGRVQRVRGHPGGLDAGGAGLLLVGSRHGVEVDRAHSICDSSQAASTFQQVRVEAIVHSPWQVQRPPVLARRCLHKRHRCSTQAANGVPRQA